MYRAKKGKYTGHAGMILNDQLWPTPRLSLFHKHKKAVIGPILIEHMTGHPWRDASVPLHVCTWLEVLLEDRGFSRLSPIRWP